MLSDFFNKKDKKSLKYLILGAAVTAVTLLLLFKILRPGVEKVCKYILESGAGGDREERIVTVEGEVVKRGPMSSRIKSIGQIKGKYSVMLKAEANLRIKEINFSEGASVKKGDVLITFNDEDFKAELREAESQLVSARSKFERSAKLYQEKVIQKAMYEKDLAEKELYEARVESAKAKLAKTKITAPSDGIVGIVKLNEGAYVQAGQELAFLVDNSGFEIEFTVPQVNANDVGPGQKIIVYAMSMKNQEEKLEGEVKSVDTRIDPETRAVSVKGSIHTESSAVYPDMFANVEVVVAEEINAIKTKESSLEREGRIDYVWFVTKGKAYRKQVIIGARENGYAQIIDGLSEGEIVVTSGQIKLNDGVNVRVANLEQEMAKEAKETSKTTPATTSTASATPVTTPATTTAQPEASKPAVTTEVKAEEPKGADTTTATKNPTEAATTSTTTTPAATTATAQATTTTSAEKNDDAKQAETKEAQKPNTEKPAEQK